MNKEQISILIPTLNEAGSIEAVILGFKEQGFSDIVVVDGHSTDDTPDIARRAGAMVHIQSGTGKGQAMKEGFSLVRGEYVVLIDGDGTYLPSEVDRLLEPLLAGRADQVVGNRLSNLEIRALKRLNRLGNRLINLLFGIIYGVQLQDILSGYRAFTKRSIDCLDLSTPGFEIESEITVESVKKGLRLIEVPITYLPRTSGTKTKLNPLSDGWRIIFTIYRLAKTQNPMFYFGIIGFAFVVMGFLMGLYVLKDWLNGRIEHIPLTILTAIFIIVGFQLFIMGILGDMMAAMHRESMQELYRRRK